MRERHLNGFPDRSCPGVETFSRVFAVTVLLLVTTPSGGDGFRPCPIQQPRPRRCQQPVLLYSSVGPGDKGGAKGDGQFGDFFFPKEESENMFRAREYMNENSLPISYDYDETKSTKDAAVSASEQIKNDAVAMDEVEEEEEEEGERNDLKSAALVSQSLSSDQTSSTTTTTTSLGKLAQDNPYFDIVSRISPSDLISKFSTTAHPRVQTAVRNTILGLLGGLPKMAFDTTTVTTGQKLASLMFQLQMTGYMFKNADYRLSLEQSLGGGVDSVQLRSEKQFLLAAGGDMPPGKKVDPLAGQVRGKLRVKLPSLSGNEEGSSSSSSTEVDAAAYVSELRNEVSKLRNELVVTKQEKDDAVRKDLLMFIRTLPQRELQSLTNTMSPDVLGAMKGLVNAVLSGIGDGEIGPDTVTEQSSEAMAQLCMWQLVIGYNLRTLEVREEIKQSMLKGADAGMEADGGISMEPGALE